MRSSTTRAASRGSTTPFTDLPTPSGYIELRGMKPQPMDGTIERGWIAVPVVKKNQLRLGA